MESQLEIWLHALSIAIIGTWAPGNSNFILINIGLHHGYRKGKIVVRGALTGFILLNLVLILCLIPLFHYFPLVLISLRILAIFYLLYLCYFLIFSKKSYVSKSNYPAHFWEAFFFQWTNLKVWTISIALLSLFSPPNTTWQNAFFIISVWPVAASTSAYIWLLAGNRLEKMIKKPQTFKWHNRTMGILLLISIISLSLGF